MHTRPEEWKLAVMQASIAALRSASGRTMSGDFPPSSSATGLSFFAAEAYTAIPVNETLVTRGVGAESCADAASAIHEVRTPDGNLASVRISARMQTLSGVTSEGLKMKVFLAASAGAHFRVALFVCQSFLRQSLRRESNIHLGGVIPRSCVYAHAQGLLP